MTGHLRLAGASADRQRAALKTILRADPLIWRALREARALDLPDWRIVAGALYNTVWNSLTGRPPPGAFDLVTLILVTRALGQP